MKLAVAEAQWTIDIPPGDAYVEVACIPCRGGESRVTLLGASTVTCTWAESERIGVVVKSDGMTATMAVPWGEPHVGHERASAMGPHRQALLDAERSGDASAVLFCRWAEVPGWTVAVKDGSLDVRDLTGQVVAPESYPGCIVRLWVYHAPAP